MSEVPGSARLVLAPGVRHLDEEAAAFTAMVTGWHRQQRAGSLGVGTVDERTAMIRRFGEFAGSFRR